MRPAIQGIIPAIRLLPDLAADKGPPLEPPAVQLAGLGHALLDAAKAHSIPAPALAPDPPTIMSALAALHSAGGACMDRTPEPPAHLWTGLAALYSGAIRQNLAKDRDGEIERQHVLALVADGLEGSLIYFANQSPIRVEQPVAVHRAAEGPYLVLALCELTARNRVVLLAAGANAVLAANRLMPVGSNLERDLLRALLHLQETLDARGVACSVDRHSPTSMDQAARLSLVLGRSGQATRTLGIVVPLVNDHAPLIEVPGDELALSMASWRDGSFMAALTRRLTAILAE